VKVSNPQKVPQKVPDQKNVLSEENRPNQLPQGPSPAAKSVTKTIKTSQKSSSSAVPRSIHQKISETTPNQVNPIQVNPIQVNQIQVKPIQVNPIQVNQIQVNPIQGYPIQVNPIQVKDIGQTKLGPPEGPPKPVKPVKPVKPLKLVKPENSNWFTVSNLRENEPPQSISHNMLDDHKLRRNVDLCQKSARKAKMNVQGYVCLIKQRKKSKQSRPQLRSGTLLERSEGAIHHIQRRAGAGVGGG
jgi:hypothetical protein